MAFKDIDQQLIDECIKEIVDFDKIKTLIDYGADINAFDDEYEQELYNEILDYYIDEEQLNLSNLYRITELFTERSLTLNQKTDDSDYFIPCRFRFLPPEKICVDIFKMLLDKCIFSFEDIETMIGDATLDLHLGEYRFFEHSQYTKENSINYYLELIYWACAYNVKAYPEKCQKELLQFNWFDRGKNKVSLLCENRYTSVFIEDLTTHKRTEIDGWTMKY